MNIKILFYCFIIVFSLSFYGCGATLTFLFNLNGSSKTDYSSILLALAAGNTNTTYTVGGNVSGLVGTLVLQNNLGDDLTITADGSFTFSTAIANGTTYDVTVKNQPSGMTCSVSNGSGTATANITNVSVSCTCNGDICREWGTFTDMLNGTIKLEVNTGTYGGNTYTSKTLYFAKCTHGQTYDSTGNTCTGTGTAVNYCSSNTNDCNGGTNSGTLNGNGTSGAYSACNGLILANKTWRVPTKDELKLLIECTNNTMPNDNSNCGSNNYSSPAINNLFPNTVSSDNYWSSSGLSAHSSGAWFVGFASGSASSYSKAYYNYVRCASDG